MNSLPTDTQFRLLKKALPECVVMAKVWGFNVKSKEDELSLVLADRDNQQFKVGPKMFHKNHIQLNSFRRQQMELRGSR